MDNSHIWDKSVLLYNSLENNRCLCSNFISHSTDYTYIILYEFSFKTMEISDTVEKYQLLSISLLRLCAEIYSENATRTQYVCKEISNVIEYFADESIFHSMVDVLLNTNDKYMCWLLTKSLTSLMHCINMSLLKMRIHFILTKLNHHMNDKKCFRLLDFITCLVSQNSKASFFEEQTSKCENCTYCNLQPVKDYYFLIHSELSRQWKKLTEIITKSSNTEMEEQRLCVFLNMWKQINEQPLQEEFSAVYLDKQYILDFLFIIKLFKPQVINLYIDVIIQILCSNAKCKPWSSTDTPLVENAVSTALSYEFLQSLSYENSGFCKTRQAGSLNQLQGEININFTSKKAIFIIMHLLTEFKDKKLLCEMLNKLLQFISEKSKSTTSNWIVDLFSESDDLLFSVMLSSIRIYNNLKEGHQESELQLAIKHYMNELNPHASFIHLLHTFGRNHCDFISFLVSNETCCLLYLTEYFKLILKEPDTFYKSHGINLFIGYKHKSIQFNMQNDLNMNSLKKIKKCEITLKSENIMNKVKQSSNSAVKNSVKKDVEKSAECVTSIASYDGSSSSADSAERLTSFVSYNSSCSNPDRAECVTSLVTYDSSSSSSDGVEFVTSLVTYEGSSSSSDNELESEFDLQQNFLNTKTFLKNLQGGIQKLVEVKEFPYNIAPFLSVLETIGNMFK